MKKNITQTKKKIFSTFAPTCIKFLCRKEEQWWLMFKWPIIYPLNRFKTSLKIFHISDNVLRSEIRFCVVVSWVHFLFKYCFLYLCKSFIVIGHGWFKFFQTDGRFFRALPDLCFGLSELFRLTHTPWALPDRHHHPRHRLYRFPPPPHFHPPHKIGLHSYLSLYLSLFTLTAKCFLKNSAKNVRGTISDLPTFFVAISGLHRVSAAEWEGTHWSCSGKLKCCESKMSVFSNTPW